MPPSAQPITIFHNPTCGTSRNVLALIRAAGIEPTVVEYLKTPYTREQLTGLLQAMDLRPREVLRTKGDLYTELGLAVKNALDALDTPVLDPRQWLQPGGALRRLAPRAVLGALARRVGRGAQP